MTPLALRHSRRSQQTAVPLHKFDTLLSALTNHLVQVSRTSPLIDAGRHMKLKCDNAEKVDELARYPMRRYFRIPRAAKRDTICAWTNRMCVNCLAASSTSTRRQCFNLAAVHLSPRGVNAANPLHVRREERSAYVSEYDESVGTLETTENATESDSMLGKRRSCEARTGGR